MSAPSGKAFRAQQHEPATTIPPSAPALEDPLGTHLLHRCTMMRHFADLHGLRVISTDPKGDFMADAPGWHHSPGGGALRSLIQDQGF